jgi:raffinose/stachyose/melibiose transport system permease protein
MSDKNMKRTKTVFAYVFLIFSSIFTIFPMLFLVNLSLRVKEDLIREGVLALPKILHFENYSKAWETGHFSTYFSNSIIISALSIIGVLVLATLISYAMVYYEFPGKEIVNILILIGLIIPFEIIIIPLFFNMKLVGLLGTRAPVYLTHIALNIPFSVFLLKGFIKDIPVSLVESARIDGARELTVLNKIIVPVIRPALVTIIILIFMWTWNDFMLSNIMLRDDKMRTLPLGLSFFKGKFTRDIPLTSAASTIIMTPVLLLYLIFQKHMIKGLTIGAVKE